MCGSTFYCSAALKAAAAENDSYGATALLVIDKVRKFGVKLPLVILLLILRLMPQAMGYLGTWLRARWVANQLSTQLAK